MASGSYPPPPSGEFPGGQDPGGQGPGGSSFPPPPGGDQGWGGRSGNQGWGGDTPAWTQSGQQGYGPGPHGYGAPPRRGNGAALAAMICGIISLVCLMLFFLLITVPVAIMTAIAAIITGIIGLRASRQEGVGGRGQAIAGLVTGSLSLVLVAAVSVAAIGVWQSMDFQSNPFTDPEGFLEELEERGVEVDEETGEVNLDELQRQLEENEGTGGGR